MSGHRKSGLRLKDGNKKFALKSQTIIFLKGLVEIGEIFGSDRMELMSH